MKKFDIFKQLREAGFGSSMYAIIIKDIIESDEVEIEICSNKDRLKAYRTIDKYDIVFKSDEWFDKVKLPEIIEYFKKVFK